MHIVTITKLCFLTATGEPSVVSAFAAVLALRNAVAAARNESGNDEWFEMGKSLLLQDNYTDNTQHTV